MPQKPVLLKPWRPGKSRTMFSNPGRPKAERDKCVQAGYLEWTLNYFLGNVSLDRLTKLQSACPIFKTLLYSWVYGGWADYSWSLGLSADNLQLLSPPWLPEVLRRECFDGGAVVQWMLFAGQNCISSGSSETWRIYVADCLSIGLDGELQRREDTMGRSTDIFVSSFIIRS